MKADSSKSTPTGNYLNVNGLNMYYEKYGAGMPLVLIHGGGSTIGTTFGRIMPLLAKTHEVIAVELQAHGHTSDRNAPESFEQDADDVAGLLNQLGVDRADIFGFSNGGNTAMQIAIRYPGIVRKLVVASSLYKKTGMPAWFWESMANAQFSDMPQIYKDEFLQINNDPAALLNMFNKDSRRMQTFEDWPDELIRSITAPVFVIVGDQDVVLPEHAVEMYRILPNAQLAILPGTHGSYMGEAMSAGTNSKTIELFISMIDEFLTMA